MWKVKYIYIKKPVIILVLLYLIVSLSAPIQQILEPFSTFNNQYH